VTPESTEYRDFNFALEGGQRIAGTVADAEGRPIQEALVRLQDSSNGDWNFFGALGRTTTNEKGQFELWIAKGGQGQWLDVSKQGCGASFFWNSQDKGDLGTLVLGRGGSIQVWS
jgi:protocatechuate 3,4-dioxygenase beta subunit